MDVHCEVDKKGSSIDASIMQSKIKINLEKLKVGLWNPPQP